MVSICKTCKLLLELYGYCDQVAPWLCMCEEIAAANLDKHQTTIVGLKERITSIWYKFE